MKSSRLIGLGLALAVSLNVSAENIIFVGAMKEDINQSGVAEIGIKSSINEYVFGSASLMWFAHEDNLYDGINLSANVGVGTDIKAYVGAGGFVGQYRYCEYDREIGEEECDYSYTGGLYPELGAQISLYRLRAAAYSRFYKTFDAGNNEYKMFGLYIGYEM